MNTHTHTHTYLSTDTFRLICFPWTGLPVVLRYWQEANVAGEWVKPDQSSGVTVETTAYVMLAALLKVT